MHQSILQDELNVRNAKYGRPIKIEKWIFIYRYMTWISYAEQRCSFLNTECPSHIRTAWWQSMVVAPLNFLNLSQFFKCNNTLIFPFFFFYLHMKPFLLLQYTRAPELTYQNKKNMRIGVIVDRRCTRMHFKPRFHRPPSQIFLFDNCVKRFSQSEIALRNALLIRGESVGFWNIWAFCFIGSI